MKYLLCFLVGGVLTTSLYAQSAGDKRSSFSVHAGPSWYLGQLMGITDRSDAYRSDLRKGVAWDVSYLAQVAGRKLKLIMFLHHRQRYLRCIREVPIKIRTTPGRIRF